MTLSLCRRAAPWQVVAALATLLSARAAPGAPFDRDNGAGLESESPAARVDPEARRLYEQALAHFKKGELDEAIAKLEAAHRIAPAAELLYNLGQAFRRKGDCKQALDWYRRFLDTNPVGVARDRAQARVSEMESCAETEAAPAAPPTQSEPGVLTPPADTSNDGAATAEPALPALVPQPKVDAGWVVAQPAPPLASTPSWWRRHKLPLMLTATTVALLCTSGYFAWSSHAASERMSGIFQHGDTWTSAEADNETSGLWHERLAIGSGVLALGTGIVATWLFWRE